MSDAAENSVLPTSPSVKKARVEKSSDMDLEELRQLLAETRQQLAKTQEIAETRGQQLEETQELAETHRKLAETRGQQLAKTQEQLAKFHQTSKMSNATSLGRRAKAMMKGSSVTEGDLSKRIPRLKAKKEYKGVLLSHVFYRTLVETLYQTNHSEIEKVEGSLDAYSKRLDNLYKLISKEEAKSIGLTAVKNKNGGICPEPVTTSLMGPIIAGLVETTWTECESRDGLSSLDPPLWCTETEMNDLGIRNQPRLDAVLAIQDFLQPNAYEGLRGLVAVENKNTAFSEKDNWEALGNGLDLFCLKKEEHSVWPMVILKFTIASKKTELIAVAPITDSTFEIAKIWTGHELKHFLFCVKALVQSTHKFVLQSKQETKYPLFCDVHKNVAFDSDNNKFYKWFYGSDHRKPNLSLVQDHMDDSARVVYEDEKDEKAIYMEMTNLGYDGAMGNDNYTTTSLSFLEITSKLLKLHAAGYVHGDIRLSNLTLCGEKSCIIDFDLAGEFNKQKYPPNLGSIQDGERHPEVKEAIEKRKLNLLLLKREHDRFSLAAVMNLFEPTKPENQTQWNEFRNRVSDIDYKDDSFLKELKDFELKIQWGATNVDESGSPPPKP